MKRLALLWLAACTSSAGRPVPEPAGFPAAIAVGTAGLEFRVARARSAGTIEAQADVSIRELVAASRGARIVKLRVLARGSDQLAAAKQAIARSLRRAGRSLPVVSFVGVAGFPDSGQRVVIEATTERPAAVNPFGVGFLAGVASREGRNAVRGLARVAVGAGIGPTDVLRVSCFYETADQLRDVRAEIATVFPNAAASFVLSFVGEKVAVVECEGVGRLSTAPLRDAVIFNLPSSTPSPLYSQAALVRGKLLFLAGRSAPAETDDAMRATLDSLKAAAAGLGGSLGDVVMADNYWLTPGARDLLRTTRQRYYGTRVPAATGLFVTSLDTEAAAAALELVVAIPDGAPASAAILTVADARIDGRFLYGHVAALTQTTTKEGVITRVDRFTLRKEVVSRANGPAFHLVLEADPSNADPKLRSETELDLRTMGLLRRDEVNGAGRHLTAEVNGAHVGGTLREREGEAAIPFEFTLSEPAFYAPFMDAALNSVDLRSGETFRVPAFGLGAGLRTVEWHTFRIVARDTIAVAGRMMPAWIAEEREGPNVRLRRIWLTREPPFFPRDVTVRPDGTEIRTEQAVIDR